MLFVLSDGENGGSFLFGPDKKACFMAENPAALYCYSSEEQRSLLSQLQSSPLLLQEHEEVKLIEGEKFKSVSISYEMYSYLILWLLEEGYLAYPSDLLASILQRPQFFASANREKNLKDLLKKEIWEKNFEDVKIGNEELYSLICKQKKTRVGPKIVKAAKLMQQSLKETLLIHLRGGWFPSLNEKIKGGLGPRCRSVLFASGKQMRVAPTSPLFNNNTDGPLVCIVNFEEKGKRAYFDPKKPTDIHILVNRIVADSSVVEGKHCIGVEDQSSYFVVPLREGDDHPLAHMFTQKKLDQDKRFKQLLIDFTPGKPKVERLMPQDTKVVTYHEFLYFLSALKACQSLAGVPEDLFEFLYTNYIVLCKTYTPITIINYLANSGWKNMTINKSRENQQIIDQMGISSHIGSKKSVHVWFHVKSSSADNKTQTLFEEDGDIRFILSPHDQRKMTKLLNAKKGFYQNFMMHVKLEEDQTEEDYYQSVIDPLCEKLRISTTNFSNKQKKRSSHYSDDEEEEDSEEDNEFIVADGEGEELSDNESEEEEESMPTRKEPLAAKHTDESNTGLFLKVMRDALQGNHNPSLNATENKKQEVIQLHGGVSLPMPPQLPVLSIAVPVSSNSAPVPHNKIYTGILSTSVSSPPSRQPDIITDPRWLSKLTLEQGNFLSSENTWADTEFTSKMISYTKHNFAPQLFSKGIQQILLKSKQDELQLRVFIMMIIERGAAEIRHLRPPPEGKMLEEMYTQSTSEEIKEDLHKFAALFSHEFLTDDALSIEETAVLCRCYCAHWMFVKQLYRTKQEAFYLQLYEFKEWVPILFSTNIPSVSSSMQIKYDSINLDVPLQKAEGQTLVGIIPSISDLLGGNSNKARSSTRTAAYKFSEFLDAFFLKHGPFASIQLQQKDGTGFPHFINRVFYFDTSGSLKINAESQETSCFSDLLYFAGVHWLRRGYFIYNCKTCRQMMLRYFLEKVCLLNEGLIKFIEYLINLEEKGVARIPGAYAWLLLVYLKHDLGDLRLKSFNDIMTAASGKCMDQMALHTQKNANRKDVNVGDTNTTDAPNIKDLFNMKYDMEMKFSVKNIRNVEGDVFKI